MIASIEEYERNALIEEAQAEMLEGDKVLNVKRKYLTFTQTKKKNKRNRDSWAILVAIFMVTLGKYSFNVQTF